MTKFLKFGESEVKAFPSGDQVWPSGETRLHVYLTPSLDTDVELRGLVEGVRSTFDGLPLVPVVDKWLHITVQPITGRAAHEIDLEQRCALRDALATHLAGLPPFTLLAGSPLTASGGVVLDITPDDLFDRLFRRVRAAIVSVLGSSAVDYDTRPAHLALAYANASPSKAQLRSLDSAVRRVRPSHAPLTITEVHLVDVEQDAKRHEFRWVDVQTIPLIAQASDTVPGRRWTPTAG